MYFIAFSGPFSTNFIQTIKVKFVLSLSFLFHLKKLSINLDEKPEKVERTFPPGIIINREKLPVVWLDLIVYMYNVQCTYTIKTALV